MPDSIINQILSEDGTESVIAAAEAPLVRLCGIFMLSESTADKERKNYDL